MKYINFVCMIILYVVLSFYFVIFDGVNIILASRKDMKAGLSLKTALIKNRKGTIFYLENHKEFFEELLNNLKK